MTVAPWVRIAIVTFNSGDFTQSCLNALSAQTNSNFEVVVFDNNSSDGKIEKLMLPDSRFSLFISPENLGFATGSNQSLKGAQTPYVMTLNADAILEPDCLATLFDASQRFPKYSMFSPILFKTGSSKILDGAGDSLSIYGVAWRNGADKPMPQTLGDVKEAAEVFSPGGAAALYRRDIFEQNSGFDDRFFCYLEDVDLGFRLRAQGEKCLLVLAAKGSHFGGHSSESIHGFKLEQSVRNNLRMILKSAPLLILPFMLIFFICLHIRFQLKHFGTAEAKFRKKGFLSGVRLIPNSIAARFRRRRYPLGSSLRIARSVTWSIFNQKRRLVWIIDAKP